MSSGDAERRRRALAIFDEVVDLDPRARAEKIDALCGGDAELRTKVEAMLAADAGGGEPFSGDAAQWVELLDAATGNDSGPEAAPVGEQVGAWRITGLLGRGGMGAVHAVERADGAYVQRAALKRVHGGETTPASRERFLRERQVLARLQHPHVATLLDGGFDAGGDPYFVMERVDGVAIDRWCDECRLGLRERVVLFLQVLDAVQYAHRNLVVHRDLKPSNLLVTPQGQVKLLDFGIARELERAGIAATATDDRAMTLQYASPEQLHNEPITTATDLYQLGVVLYRLLSGRHPFGIDADTPLARQLQALSRDPEPITRSARQLDADMAAKRGETPASLARAHDGGLEAIVHACLRRDPAERYASAEALGNDLRAWLDDRPVSAAKLGRGQRTRLWLRRNRALAASVAAISLALLAGTGVALWQAHEAREQARIAERESEGARASLAFLADTLAAAAPAQAMSTEVSVRQLLDNARVQLEQKPLDPRARRSIQRLLGNLYSSLGEPKVAASLFEAGLDGVLPQQRDEALALAKDLDGYASTLATLERGKESLATARRALALREGFAPGDAYQRFLGHRQLALAYTSMTDCKQADAEWRQAMASVSTARDMQAAEAAQAAVSYSRMLFNCGEYARGFEVAEAGLAAADKAGLPALAPARADLLWTKAVNGAPIDKLEGGDAEALLRQAIAMHEKTIGTKGTQLGEYYSSLGTMLQVSGRLGDALIAHERSAELSRAAGARPLDQAITQYNIGYLYRDHGDYPKSLAAHARSLAIFEEAGVDEDHLEYRRARKWQALAMIQAGQAAEARERLLPLKERARELDGVDSVEHADVTWQLLRAAVAMQDVARGEPLLAEARERSAKFVPSTHQVFIEFLRHEATLATLRGDMEGAERLRRDALAREIANNGLTAPWVARAELAGLLVQRGRRAEAAVLLREALPALREHLLPRHVDRAKAELLAQQLGV